MSEDFAKIDPFYMALTMVSNAPTIKHQVDVISFVIDGKIAQLWEEAPGMTREKTRLIEVKHRLQELRKKNLDVQPPKSDTQEEQERYENEFNKNKQPIMELVGNLLKHYAPPETDSDDDLGEEY